VCTRRGARVLRVAVKVVAEFVDSKAVARAFVVSERLQMRDGQPQLMMIVMMIVVCVYYCSCWAVPRVED
jgi:hypothetical protein